MPRQNILSEYPPLFVGYLEKKMTAYEDFIWFAWEHLEDVYGITESDGIPDRSPYMEFVVGCAAIALYNSAGGFGFTMDQILRPSKENLASRFYKEFCIMEDFIPSADQ